MKKEISTYQHDSDTKLKTVPPAKDFIPSRKDWPKPSKKVTVQKPPPRTFNYTPGPGGGGGQKLSPQRIENSVEKKRPSKQSVKLLSKNPFKGPQL
jgi:hypothetical protein